MGNECAVWGHVYITYVVQFSKVVVTQEEPLLISLFFTIHMTNVAAYKRPLGNVIQCHKTPSPEIEEAVL